MGGRRIELNRVSDLSLPLSLSLSNDNFDHISPPMIRVLRMLAQATSSKSVPELFDFGSSLAQRLSDLLQLKKLTPTSPLWVYAVDNLLVRAVDSHVQVC